MIQKSTGTAVSANPSFLGGTTFDLDLYSHLRNFIQKNHWLWDLLTFTNVESFWSDIRVSPCFALISLGFCIPHHLFRTNLFSLAEQLKVAAFNLASIVNPVFEVSRFWSILLSLALQGCTFPSNLDRTSPRRMCVAKFGTFLSCLRWMPINTYLGPNIDCCSCCLGEAVNSDRLRPAAPLRLARRVVEIVANKERIEIPITYNFRRNIRLDRNSSFHLGGRLSRRPLGQGRYWSGSAVYVKLREISNFRSEW